MIRIPKKTQELIVATLVEIIGVCLATYKKRKKEDPPGAKS